MVGMERAKGTPIGELVKDDVERRVVTIVGMPCGIIDEEKKMAEEEIMGKLNNLLENKRYLVVLDDLWTQAVWDDFEKAFPNGKSGSKIMLTSRNERLAAYADPRTKCYCTPKCLFGKGEAGTVLQQ
ncbi:hypothetical protein Syun_019689 [Stephania yunnanensis]|uniref:NB-ARC domain-containing protein n=1 Tax=Stephania yunnanensis TaxID=152371 RepID=A0AAP0IWK1_9MAGN